MIIILATAVVSAPRQRESLKSLPKRRIPFLTTSDFGIATRGTSIDIAASKIAWLIAKPSRYNKFFKPTILPWQTPRISAHMRRIQQNTLKRQTLPRRYVTIRKSHSGVLSSIKWSAIQAKRHRNIKSTFSFHGHVFRRGCYNIIILWRSLIINSLLFIV